MQLNFMYSNFLFEQIPCEYSLLACQRKLPKDVIIFPTTWKFNINIQGEKENNKNISHWKLQTCCCILETQVNMSFPILPTFSIHLIQFWAVTKYNNKVCYFLYSTYTHIFFYIVYTYTCNAKIRCTVLMQQITYFQRI